MKDLTTLFAPKSVAIIGASRSQKKLGFIVLRNIIESGFRGRIYPINPNAEAIYQLKCFPDYSSLPEIPDLAIISIPSNYVVDSVLEIVKKGTKNLVIFSAGFKEIGEEGEKLENKLKEIISKYQLNLLGPNCLGFVNNLDDINATFGHNVKNIGNLKFISQSGAIASSIFDWAQYSGIGFSDFVTLGNKAGVNEVDILEFWNNEKKEITPAKKYFLKDNRLSSVTPIGLYLESIEYGEDFLNIASQITLSNPMFVLKPGKSTAAKNAMQSHTGAIAGEDFVFEAALKHSGIIRCEGVEDMFDLAKAFSWENSPQGPNVAIISNAGGPAVISADFIEEAGLKLAKISEFAQRKLAEHLPKSSNFMNPIDVLGDALAVRYAHAVDILLAQANVDALIIILTPQIMTQIQLTADYIGRLSALYKKPILCAFMGGNYIEKGEKILNMHKIPSFRFPERAIKALGKMWWWQDQKMKRSLRIKNLHSEISGIDMDIVQKSRVSQILNIARNSGKTTLNPFEANEILKSWNIKTPPSDVINSFNFALEFVKNNGWPVVMKLSSNYIMHKTELGGVIVNINNRRKLKDSFNLMQKRISSLNKNIKDTVSIQIQKQVDKGIELILGVKKDPNFGHVLMFGAGGINAEILEDRNLKLLPLDKYDARKLVMNSKIFKLLNGFRGQEAYALDKLYSLIEKMSDLVIEFPEIKEIEINPVIITHEDVYAVDGKAVI